jgi:hypothetical protein
MTDEERIAKAKQLVNAKQQVVQADVLKSACYSCRYWDGWTGRLAYCSNDVAALEGSSILGSGIRSADGLCGPNALYWEQRGWWVLVRIWEGATGNRLRPKLVSKDCGRDFT